MTRSESDDMKDRQYTASLAKPIMEANVIPGTRELPTFQLVFMFVIDLAMYLLFMVIGRSETWIEDCAMMTVVHYYSWHIITDIVFFVIPNRFRNYCNVFRLLRGLSFQQSAIWLLVAGADGPDKTLSGVRIGISGLSFLHAAVCLYMYGPTSYEEIESLFRNAVKNFRNAPLKDKIYFAPFMLSVGGLMFSELYYRMHTNFGDPRIDAPMSSMQAGMGIVVQLKVGLLGQLVETASKRAFMAFVIFFFFAIQWWPMWNMFYLAPIPVVHIIGEFTFFMDFMTRCLEWKQKKEVIGNSGSAASVRPDTS